MINRFFRLKVAVPVAAVALAAGGLIAIPKLQAVAQAFSPPAFDDALIFPVDKRGFRRLGVNTWACGGGCVAARTGGAARRGCVLYMANVTGAFRAAADDCSVAIAAACNGAAGGQAVDDCVSGERF